MRKRTYANTKRTRSQSRPSKKARKNSVVPKLGTASPFSRGRYIKARLTYASSVQLNPGISSAGVKVFTANGLYDPDISGIGHQPAGFDQYMALYNEYIVTRSWIKVVFTNTDANGQQACGISFLDKETTSADARKYIEQGSCKWGGIEVYKSGSILTITHEADIRKVSTQDIFTEDNFAADATRNPADTHYWHIWAAPFDLVSDTSPINAMVEIQYEVYFRDPSFTDLS